MVEEGSPRRDCGGARLLEQFRVKTHIRQESFSERKSFALPGEGRGGRMDACKPDKAVVHCDQGQMPNMVLGKGGVMAELLVRAESSINPSASEVGDIIVVRPDGFVWGSLECLPEYLQVKLPQISYDDIKHFELSLLDTTGPHMRLVKRRKWHIPSSWVAQKVALGETVVTITVPTQKLALIQSVLEKTI